MGRLKQTKIFAVFLMLAMAYLLIYIGVRNRKEDSLNTDKDLPKTLCSSVHSNTTTSTNVLKNLAAMPGTRKEKCHEHGNIISSSTQETGAILKHIGETSAVGITMRKSQLRQFKKAVPPAKRGKVKYIGPHGDAPPLPTSNSSITFSGKDKLYVLILAYQRSGSSFSGDLLNRNPSVFYVYEPLDALYSSLYGIPPGWSVPSDITAYQNGSFRKLPNYEVKAATDVISDLLECSFSHLPKEVLVSHFWLQFWSAQINVLDFTKCMARNKVKVAQCQSLYLRRVCAPRLGISRKKEDRCYHFLHHHAASNSDMAIKVKYIKCLLTEADKARPCIPMLENRCKRSPVRGVKTVRATMQVAEQLLERHNNLKVLHLIRDPRPVLLSRMHHDSFRATASKKSMISEASFYCNTVYGDLQIRKELEHKYSDRIAELVYEDFTSNLLQKAVEVYKFLEIPFREDIRKWLVRATGKSAQLAHAWHTKIKDSDKIQINTICKDVLRYGQKYWN